MDDLKSRIKTKTAAISKKVFKKGYEIILHSGRVIVMDSLDQIVTYAGVLEGWPNSKRNDRLIERLVAEYSRFGENPYVLSAPREGIQFEPDEEPHFMNMSHPQPELLPHITCIGNFTSLEPTITDSNDYDLSYLDIIWFQDDWAMPIAPEAFDALQAIDWDKIAHNGWI